MLLLTDIAEYVFVNAGKDLNYLQHHSWPKRIENAIIFFHISSNKTRHLKGYPNSVCLYCQELDEGV